jgi:hypothetical protein
MIHGPVEPCPPDNDEKENKCTDASQTHIPSKRVGKFGNDDHIDQIIEKLQKGNAALFRMMASRPRRLPPTAKTDSV